MCGIVGYIGRAQAVPVLLSSLERLEYRGYDSAGIAIIDGKELKVLKRKGKISNLVACISGENFKGKIGISHCRWATHGEPSDVNAHPHTDCSGKIAIVHNGIIEDFVSLRERLSGKHKIISDTDTELIAHLIEEKAGEGILQAVIDIVRGLKGSYAIAVISADEPDKIITARRGSPLIIGIWEGIGYLVASDIPSILPYTRKVIVLEEDDIAEVSLDGLRIFDRDDNLVKKPVQIIPWDMQRAQKGGYKHFMLKEIFEQPRAVEDTIKGFVSVWGNIPRPDRVTIVACGTSFYAGLVGKLWLEEVAKIPTDVDYSSEFRYREKAGSGVIIAVSQSGETADTLEAVRISKSQGVKVIGIVNVLGSTLTREADFVAYTHAGPEIGVAATKTFSAQLVALYLLSLMFAGEGRGSRKLEKALRLPQLIDETLKKCNSKTERISEEIYHFANALYLGRWLNYPIALEGALKLKEISYMHAEGYPAGEMKHGPIALIDKDMLSVFVAPKDRVYEKVISNIQEIKSRRGKILAVATEGNEKVKDFVDRVIYIPPGDELLMPFLTIIPLQLLAYHTAVKRGCDIDQPRNLAKSVTVE